MAFGVHRVADGTDHVLVSAWRIRNVFEHFGNGLAGDGEAVAMQQAGHQQGFHHLWDAAGAVQVHRQVLAAGLEVAQHGGFHAHALKVVNRPVDLGSVGDRQEVQHGVGGSSCGHDHGDCVFDRLASHDVTRLDVFLDGFHQNFGRLPGGVELFVVRVCHGAGVGQRDAQRLEGRGHGVGGVHAATGTGARYRPALDLQQVRIAQATGGVFAHSLKHADDVQVTALVVPRQDGAAVNIDGRHIGAQHAHQSSGHVFVTATDHHHAVHPLALDAGLDAVRDHFPADQRVLHALGPHGHAVRDGGCTKHLSVATGLFNAGNRGISQLLQARIAGCDGAVAVGHADHGFFEVVGFIAHGVVHGSIRRARLALCDVFAARVDGMHRDNFGIAHGCRGSDG